MAISKKIKAFYTGFWDRPETFVANMIECLLEKRSLKKYLDKTYKLSKEQKKEIKNYWKPYKKISSKWCRYYVAKNGKFDPRYIPNTLYYTKIDQYFNSRKLGYGFNDKNYYSTVFNDIKQPTTVLRKIGILLFDEDYKLVDIQKALELIKTLDEVVIKPSQESGSGRGIGFHNTKDDIEKIRLLLEDKKEKDFIIQGVVNQHPDLAKVHKDSLNTLRIVSLLMDDGVYILSSVLRMGVNSSRIDNVTAGGISAKINFDGTLDKYAYTYFTGERFEKHPQGLVFEGYQIPYFEKVIETVKKAAQRIGNFRLVSWDMSIDKDGDVVLIEANMRKGGINLHQFDNGPLFGDLTDRVLKEVFAKQ